MGAGNPGGCGRMGERGLFAGKTPRFCLLWDGLMTVFVIQKEEEVFEILKDSMLRKG